MLRAIARTWIRLCLRGLRGSARRSPIGTERQCSDALRRVWTFVHQFQSRRDCHCPDRADSVLDVHFVLPARRLREGFFFTYAP